MSKTYRIAVIPGDGIGKEVMPEGLRVLQAVQRRFGVELALTPIDWASCDHYAKTGQMMPDDWKAQLLTQDAILFGAVGWPATVPDHVSLWGSLLKFRREFDQYINLRPVRLFDGVPCPLVDAQGKPRKPGDIDFLVVRENKTYDGLFGDLPGGKGDPTMTMIPKEEMDGTWTNIRKLARSFSFSDNFYTSAFISTQGHLWTTHGRTDDFNEREWPVTGYGRGLRGDADSGGAAGPGASRGRRRTGVRRGGAKRPP